jgi:phospholipase C
METRRSFIKKSVLLSGALGVSQFLPESIQRALTIAPEPGTDFMHAEHIVLLMQENRSFDHTFGTLRGVRGFRDPRVIRQPNRNKVWLQTNHDGETYCPFRLDIKNTKITWMGSLPHGRRSQMEARNNGKYDNWLEAKKSDDNYEYGRMPLTMGFYTREDIPFYYALADAFTVCDQNFCSSLTGTDPNRLYFWSGTVRQEQHSNSKPYVQNDDVERGVEWETFPEILEKNGVSWKVYQNEIGQDHGFTDEQDVWLGNFGDNPLEYFRQYNVKLTRAYIDYLPVKVEKLKKEIAVWEAKTKTLPAGSKDLEDAQNKLKYAKEELEHTYEEQKTFTQEHYEHLTQHQKNVHGKAFVTNTGDPHQHELESVTYQDDNHEKEINIPKGDLFHQFRQDVQDGNLPTVSWLVAPEYFSDHPSAPWFGSWYLSEAMDILTKNPEIWKKTIFILAYDENDGYFDHQPPFVAPEAGRPETGAVSAGIDTGVEHVKLAQDSPGSIGLGYRVPLIVASPWTRGGWVNSQVFDHTSTLQFLEVFLSKKTGREIKAPLVSQFRRAVCGDLTSVFQAEPLDKKEDLPFVVKNEFIEGIYKAKFKSPPINYRNLSREEIGQINGDPGSSTLLPSQEKGTRLACAIPYELYVDGTLSPDRAFFQFSLHAGNQLFKGRSAGSPFSVYSYGREMKLKSYAVKAGDRINDRIDLKEFEHGDYDIEIHGPNGFMRAFRGSAADAGIGIRLSYPESGIVLEFSHNQKTPIAARIVDNAYKSFGPINKDIDPGVTKVNLDIQSSKGWYDFSFFMKGNDRFEWRYAGHVESGKPSISDPFMGGEV